MDIMRTVFMRGKEEDVRWVLRGGGVVCVLKKVGEKKERKDSVKVKGLWGLKEFLEAIFVSHFKFRRVEMKGRKEWRDGEWMIEREGGCDWGMAFLLGGNQGNGLGLCRTLGINVGEVLGKEMGLEM
jgi:hypothetical protein